MAQLILRARAHYDVWWIYEGADTRPDHTDVLNQYVEFFRFDSHAHLVSMVMYLSQLLESRPDTLNLPTVVKEAADAGVNAAAVDKAKTALAQSAHISSKVAILRNNLFGHRSAKISYQEVFEKAAVTPNQLRDFTVLGLEVVNPLLEARGKLTWEFRSGTADHTVAMLKALRGRCY